MFNLLTMNLLSNQDDIFIFYEYASILTVALAILFPFLAVMGQQSNIDLEQKVIGCYSAGDRGSTVMRITKRFIQTENGKQRLPYKVVEIKPKSIQSFLSYQPKTVVIFLENI